MSQRNAQSVGALTNYMFAKASIEQIPLSGTFELTPICNFNCRMCYVRKSPREVAEHERPLKTLEEWLQIAREACSQGMLHLLLTGGEPTLWPDFWQLYEELIGMGILISINTNGSLLDEKAIMHLVQKPPRRINLTLYGASDETYKRLCGVDQVFTKVDRAIQLLQEHHIPVKLNCSLTPYNVCDLEQMIQYAKDRQLILEIATYMFPPIRKDADMIGKNDRFTPQEAARYRMEAYRLMMGEEKYQDYLKQILKGSILPPGLDEQCVDPIDGKIRCRAGKASFWITWDGWLTPCGMMNRPKVDTRGKAFADAWKELTQMSQELRLSGICKDCPDMEICHSCAAMALAETGDAAGIPKYLCESVGEMKNIARHEIRSN